MSDSLTTLPCDGWSLLREKHPWPAKQPLVSGPYVARMHGWLSPDTKAMIRAHLPSSGIVVELGTWMGKSAKFMLDSSPGIRLVCIDHWRGSPDINQTRAHREMLPYIFDLCQYHLWPYRERLVLLQREMREGMRQVAEAGLEPGLVYVDGAHGKNSVFADVEGAHGYFPYCRLVGDDWDRQGVREGVALARDLCDGRVHNNGKAWMMESES